MRCPDCSKFVGLELEEEPEENSEPEFVDDGEHGGTVTASYKIVRNCSECGTELKSAEFELEGEVTLYQVNEQGDPTDVVGHMDDCDPDAREFEVEGEAEATETMQLVDRKGKPITNRRYAKTLYGVSVEVNVTCGCGATGCVTLADSVPAGQMDESV